MSELMFHTLIFDSLQNKKFINYLISFYGEILLANCGITATERYFIYYDHFEVYFSMIGIDESEHLCWKHKMFLFRRRKKVIYTFVITYQLHNKNKQKIQKFMFILLFCDSSRYIYCGFFISAFCIFFISSSLVVVKSFPQGN